MRRAERPKEEERVVEVSKEAPAVEIPEKPPVPEGQFPKLPAPLKLPPPPKARPEDPILAQIEAILEEDIGPIYAAMSPEAKSKFKAKGEEVAQVIRAMIERAKVKANKVLKLIRDWLKLIPGINRFFLEQETAIKTQKIIAVAKSGKK